MTLEHIAGIIHRQRTYFATKTTQKLSFRIQQLTALKRALIRYEGEIYQALNTDLKKPIFESFTTELYQVINEIDLALRCLYNWSRPSRIKMEWPLWPSRAQTVHEPLGVVLIIAPWNYPLQLNLIPLVGAIAAGNCAILKPSEQAPATAEILERIIKATFDADFITVMQGDEKIAQRLLQHRFDYLFFTGSTRVGRLVMQAAAEHLTPVTMELGGKNPTIIARDAHLGLAAKKIVWAKFLNAGQSCVAPDFLLVDAHIKDQFLEILKKTIQRFFGTDARFSADYGRIVNEKHFHRLTKLLETGNIVYGGTHEKKELYLDPTIIDGVTLNDQIMKEEIFGPILAVLTFKQPNTALDIIQNFPKPLGIYLFTVNRKLIKQFQRNSSSGSLVINDALVQAGSSHLPFGGVGASGFGRYHGKKSFDTFSNIKTIVKSSSWFDTTLRFPPYTGLKKIMARLLWWTKKR